MSRAFFDTNVLVYIDDGSAPTKQQRASRLFEEHFVRGTAVLSLQVLQEYFVTVTRKLSVAPQLAQRKVEIFCAANVVRFEVADVIAAIELHRLSDMSFWDALIVHAARLAGASVLYSEDFQHNAILAGVRVVNPFAS
jgi:predicted nucleic acid-binding protein